MPPGRPNGKIVLRDGVTEPQDGGHRPLRGQPRQQLQQLLLGHLLHAESEVRPPGQRDAPARTVYNFYIDMRTPAKAYDEFYQRVLEEGTLFVRGKVAEVTDAARLPGEEGKLIIQVEDTLAGKQRRIPVDMVILSAGLEPRHDAKEVAQTVRHLVQRRRLVHREAPQARPGGDDDRRHLHRRLRARARRIFRQSCRRARRRRRACWAASSRRRSRWSRCAPASTQDQCSGCRICNNLCPFNAIIFHRRPQGVTEINPALCQGCGTCVAACPAGAITGTGFSNEQILAQIEGCCWLGSDMR